MKQLHLHTSSLYLFESFDNLPAYFKGRNTVIVTDETVKSLYESHFPDVPIITLKEGEQNKNLSSVEYLYAKFLEHKVDRSSLIVAVGGGIVCDIAGFAAATYMRGIAYGCVPTTLLAQVDASIGGKNGVNFNSLKNIVGTFRQPEFVVIDPAFLGTLSPRHMRNGLMEVVKHAIIFDAELFDYIEDNSEFATKTSSAPFSHLLERAIAVKIAVVAQDEKENGLRKILNFGHTIGHAIEATHTTVLHGEAVGIGMIYATEMAFQRDLVSQQEFDRIRNVILSFGRLPRVNLTKLSTVLFADKKKRGKRIDFVLPDGIGKAKIIPLTEEEII